MQLSSIWPNYVRKPFGSIPSPEKTNLELFASHPGSLSIISVLRPSWNVWFTQLWFSTIRHHYHCTPLPSVMSLTSFCSTQSQTCQLVSPRVSCQITEFFLLWFLLFCSADWMWYRNWDVLNNVLTTETEMHLMRIYLIFHRTSVEHCHYDIV